MDTRVIFTRYVRAVQERVEVWRRLSRSSESISLSLALACLCKDMPTLCHIARNERGNARRSWLLRPGLAFEACCEAVKGYFHARGLILRKPCRGRLSENCNKTCRKLRSSPSNGVVYAPHGAFPLFDPSWPAMPWHSIAYVHILIKSYCAGFVTPNLKHYSVYAFISKQWPWEMFVSRNCDSCSHRIVMSRDKLADDRVWFWMWLLARRESW